MSIKVKYPFENTHNYSYQAEKELIIKQHDKIQQRIFGILYLHLILFFIYLIIMEIKRQYQIDFIPGFNNPLQDLYEDIMKDINI
ncbi:MAG: hypothetical protein ACK4K9_11505 [Bacteroidia bacterium]